MSIQEIQIANRNLIIQYAEEFQRIFHFRLRPFVDLVTGFDIIRFDDEVVKSGTRQMEAVIRKDYGQAGVDLVKALLKVQVVLDS